MFNLPTIAPETKSLLSGIAQTGLLGAGAGALGMGAASALGPGEAEETGDQKTKRILKSMLLGGALGGGIGAGGRAIGNAFSENLRHDPTTGVEQIKGKLMDMSKLKEPADVSKLGLLRKTLAGHPGAAGATAGLATTGLTALSHGREYAKDAAKALKGKTEPTVPDTGLGRGVHPRHLFAPKNYFKSSFIGRYKNYPQHTSLGRGLAVGGPVYLLSAILRGHERMRQGYEAINTPDRIREQLAKQSIK